MYDMFMCMCVLIWLYGTPRPKMDTWGDVLLFLEIISASFSIFYASLNFVAHVKGDSTLFVSIILQLQIFMNVLCFYLWFVLVHQYVSLTSPWPDSVAQYEAGGSGGGLHTQFRFPLSSDDDAHGHSCPQHDGHRKC